MIYGNLCVINYSPEKKKHKMPALEPNELTVISASEIVVWNPICTDYGVVAQDDIA